MATSSSSITAATASPVVPSTAKPNVTKTLGGGSGIDIQSLAGSLFDAERAPRAAAINKNISKNEATVSGFAAVKYGLTTIQTALADLKDVSDYQSFSLSNSDTTTFTATATSAASAGKHSILVGQLAAATRLTGTTAFADTDTSINSASAMTLKVSIGASGSTTDTYISVSGGNDTPEGIVSAINDADLGLTAYLVNNGDATSPYQIVVSGTSGSDYDFSITSYDGTVTSSTSSPTALTSVLFDTTLESAQDAYLEVDGISITSSSNEIADSIPGVTLNLIAANGSYNSSSSTTAGLVTGTAATLSLSNDVSVAKTKITAFVTAYNDAMDLFDELINPKSSFETYGGTLSGNSSLRSLREQLRTMMTDDSSTTSGDLEAFRDIGVEFNSSGKLTINTVTLDVALNFNFSDTVTLLSGDQENLSKYDTSTDAGLAGDLNRLVFTMLSSSGTISKESANATTRISKYQDDLIALEDRMARMLTRYTKQFASMDSIVGEGKNTQAGLTNTFAGMMNLYK